MGAKAEASADGRGRPSRRVICAGGGSPPLPREQGGSSQPLCTVARPVIPARRLAAHRSSASLYWEGNAAEIPFPLPDLHRRGREVADERENPGYHNVFPYC